MGKGEIWKAGHGLSGRVERGENLQEDRPPTRSNWGHGDQALSWSPVSPELGSFSQVSGANEQEEEAALRGPEGLPGCVPFGVLTPGLRGQRGASPAPPRRSSCSPGLLPSRDRESLACSGPAAWGQGPLAGPPLCPCQDRDRQPAQMTKLTGDSLCGEKSLLAGGLSKAGDLYLCLQSPP